MSSGVVVQEIRPIAKDGQSLHMKLMAEHRQHSMIINGSIEIELNFITIHNS